jgi:glycosyltransferase involved in cell wall biosynthesis
MVEAMATGTPVIAINRGSVPEVVEDGKTGFICESLEEMASKVELAKHIDRRMCREVVDTRFSVQVMADGYEAAYLGVIGD